MSSIGGAQRVASELLDALEAHPGIKLHKVIQRSAWRWIYPRTFGFEFSLPFRLPRAVKRGEIDFVLFTSMMTAIPTVVSEKKIHSAGAKIGAIALGMEVTHPFPINQVFLRKMFRALDAVFPISRATGEECLVRGLPERNMHVIPCGIDLGYFERLADRAESGEDARKVEEVRPPNDAFLLFSVGRHVRRKGFGWFIEHVLPNLPDDVHYWIAGKGPETPNIRQLIGQLGLQERVRLLGTVDEEQLHRLYRAADLYIMPNIKVPGDIEGFGVVMLEAGLRGLPTVAAEIDGIRDVIVDGENGRFCPSGDAQAFKDAILALKEDRKELERIAARAPGFVRDKFSWEAVADRFVVEMSRACGRETIEPSKATV